MNKELTKALSAVDDARAEYNKSLPKVSPETDTDRGDPMAASAGFQLDYQGTDADHSFVYWFKAGFAFTLPLILLGVIYIFVVLARNPLP